MPETVVYVGPESNLGRWGFVKDGDILTLTTGEANALTGDRRFRLPPPGHKQKPVQEAKVNQTRSESDHDFKRRIRDAQAEVGIEKARRENIGKHNAEPNVFGLELSELDYTQIRANAEKMIADGYVIELTNNTARAHLIQMMIRAFVNQPKPKKDKAPEDV